MVRRCQGLRSCVLCFNAANKQPNSQVMILTASIQMIVLEHHFFYHVCRLICQKFTLFYIVQFFWESVSRNGRNLKHSFMYRCAFFQFGFLTVTELNVSTLFSKVCKASFVQEAFLMKVELPLAVKRSNGRRMFETSALRQNEWANAQNVSHFRVLLESRRRSTTTFF